MRKPSRCPWGRFLAGMAVAWGGLAGGGCQSEEQMRIRETAEALDALVGSRVRVVWAEDNGDSQDVAARGTNRMLRLMGYDSRDGIGARPMQRELSNYSKPMLTPRGDRVVFSDFQETIVSIVDFDGANRRKLADGMGLAVWRDPETGTEWAYVGRKRVERRTGVSYEPVERFPIDRPDRPERVWDGGPVGENNFQLSADGRRAGGVFPWPDAGIADLAAGTWTRLGKGCWTSLAPDHSGLFWIFKGNHRELEMFDPRNDRRWTVPIDAAPGIDGGTVYHPRWSNHPRILAVTGPYKTRGGGPDVDVYLGRFNEDFTEIEAWVRVTRGDRADYLPDVWIESAATISFAPPPAILDGDHSVPEAAWPMAKDDLLFVWETHAQNNVIQDYRTGGLVTCRVEPEGRARFGRFQEMDVRRGRFVADGAEPRLEERFREKPEFTLEARITPAAVPSSSTGLVVGMSSGPDRRNFALVQEGGSLRFEWLASGREGARLRRRTLFELVPNEPVHVVIACEPGQLRAYRNGEPIGSEDLPEEDFRDWRRHPLVFGGDAEDADSWAGNVEGVALYGRALSPEEAAAHHALYAQRLADRRLPEQAVVEARLIGATPVPDPKAIAPYRRALVVNEYEVRNVRQGSLPHPRILVAHWAIMDGQRLEAAERKIGKTYRMTLERFEDRPELEGEWIGMEVEDPLLPTFYDLDS